MRHSPSIIPGVDHDTYLVQEDYGRLGRAWRETDVGDTDLESVIADMLEGQLSNPVRVISFNTAEGWSRDVSEDVAHELRQRCADQGRLLSPWSSSSIGTRDMTPRSNCRYRSVSSGAAFD